MEATALSQKLHENIKSCIVGKDDAIDLMLISLLCGGHLLIEDVPGIGKTTLALALAKSTDCSFKRIQFTPDVLPSDITGFTTVNIKNGDFEYHPGAIMGQIVLADEINRTLPKTQSSLLEAMEEGQITVDGAIYELPQPFMVLATQNPIEFVGTYPLPEAQLDRFFMRISIGYPTLRDEVEILTRHDNAKPIDSLKAIASAQDIIELRQKTQSVMCVDEIKQYISMISAQTRDCDQLQLGVSPRGTLALMLASKGYALLSGRSYVIPDDVQAMVKPVLSHRIIMRPEARIRGCTPEQILDQIIQSIKVPLGPDHPNLS